jgi:hypothetical protein
MDTEAKVECGVYTRKQLVAYLGVHLNTIDRSDLPRIKIAGRVLYRKSTVEKWLREKESTNGKYKGKNHKKVLVIPLGDS